MSSTIAPESLDRRIPRPAPNRPRHFVPGSADLGSWDELRPLFEDLLARPIQNEAERDGFLADLGELGDAVGEEGSRRYIDMSCDTRDPDREKAYLHFVEELDPKMAPFYDALNRKIAADPFCKLLPKESHGLWLQSVHQSLELYHEENIPLFAELAKLSQTYQKIQGEMTVDWRGEVKTLSQLAPHLQDPDRNVREEAWRLSAERRLKDRDALESLFDQMLDLRRRIAAKLGLPDFRAYCFKASQRIDYTPEDCLAFHKAIENVVMPLQRRIQEHRRQQMGLEKLRPWDLSCDPLGRPPLRPFAQAEELVKGVGSIFENLDPELGKLFAILRDGGLMDLENRIGKAPGGYQSSLSEVRLPFIFMNAVGMNGDVFTLLHESGHAFHFLLARGESLPFNRHACMEFSEVASMSMERLGMPYLDCFYDASGKSRAMRIEDEEVFRLLPWVATIDAFQHWLYLNPHTSAERTAKWIELDERFGSTVDWTGLEQYRPHGWHRQLHLFEVPFYYIEYGIAQLGALQMWEHSLRDLPGALAAYKRGLSMGGRKSLKGLFEAAGLKLDFTEAGLKPALAAIEKEWESVKNA